MDVIACGNRHLLPIDIHMASAADDVVVLVEWPFLVAIIQMVGVDAFTGPGGMS
jgi:hypothetical protein